MARLDCGINLAFALANIPSKRQSDCAIFDDFNLGENSINHRRHTPQTIVKIWVIAHGLLAQELEAGYVFDTKKLPKDFVELVSEMLPKIDFDMHELFGYSIAQGSHK